MNTMRNILMIETQILTIGEQLNQIVLDNYYRGSITFSEMCSIYGMLSSWAKEAERIINCIDKKK